jgi:hypothetical protein
MSDEPMVTSIKLCSMQVCVPKDWSDDKIERFANSHHPTGIDHDWHIRKQEDYEDPGRAFRGKLEERVECEARPDFIHVLLDC